MCCTLQIGTKHKREVEVGSVQNHDEQGRIECDDRRV